MQKKKNALIETTSSWKPSNDQILTVNKNSSVWYTHKGSVSSLTWMEWYKWSWSLPTAGAPQIYTHGTTPKSLLSIRNKMTIKNCVQGAIEELESFPNYYREL